MTNQNIAKPLAIVYNLSILLNLIDLLVDSKKKIITKVLAKFENWYIWGNTGYGVLNHAVGVFHFFWSLASEVLQSGRVLTCFSAAVYDTLQCAVLHCTAVPVVQLSHAIENQKSDFVSALYWKETKNIKSRLCIES